MLNQSISGWCARFQTFLNRRRLRTCNPDSAPDPGEASLEEPDALSDNTPDDDPRSKWSSFGVPDSFRRVGRLPGGRRSDGSGLLR